MLEGYGFAVGKIWSNGVSFGPFDYSLNKLNSGPNFLAVLKSESTLLRRLQRAE